MNPLYGDTSDPTNRMLVIVLNTIVLFVLFQMVQDFFKKGMKERQTQMGKLNFAFGFLIAGTFFVILFHLLHIFFFDNKPELNRYLYMLSSMTVFFFAFFIESNYTAFFSPRVRLRFRYVISSVSLTLICLNIGMYFNPGIERVLEIILICILLYPLLFILFLIILTRGKVQKKIGGLFISFGSFLATLAPIYPFFIDILPILPVFTWLITIRIVAITSAYFLLHSIDFILEAQWSKFLSNILIFKKDSHEIIFNFRKLWVDEGSSRENSAASESANFDFLFTGFIMGVEKITEFIQKRKKTLFHPMVIEQEGRLLVAIPGKFLVLVFICNRDLELLHYLLQKILSLIEFYIPDEIVLNQLLGVVDTNLVARRSGLPILLHNEFESLIVRILEPILPNFTNFHGRVENG